MAVFLSKSLSESLCKIDIHPLRLLDLFPMLKQRLCAYDALRDVERIVSPDVPCTRYIEIVELDNEIFKELLEERGRLHVIRVMLQQFKKNNPGKVCTIYDIIQTKLLKDIVINCLDHPGIDPLKLCIMSNNIELLLLSCHNESDNNFDSVCKYFTDERVRYMDAYRLLFLSRVNIRNRHTKIRLQKLLDKEIMSRLLLFKELLSQDVYIHLLSLDIF